jgi:hypothetical protein
MVLHSSEVYIMEFIVLLDNQTTGRLLSHTSPVIGSTVTIITHDDGGCPLEVRGVLTEVLEQVEPRDRWAAYLGMDEE